MNEEENQDTPRAGGAGLNSKAEGRCQSQHSARVYGCAIASAVQCARRATCTEFDRPAIQRFKRVIYG
jgi:hypothetical protein